MTPDDKQSYNGSLVFLTFCLRKEDGWVAGFAGFWDASLIRSF